MKYQRLKKYALTKNLEHNHLLPSGASGTYYKLPYGVGVKVYFGSGCRHPNKVRRTEEWWEACRALGNMRKVYSSGLVPKGYCVAPVKVDGYYYVGLFMQHIEGTHESVSDRTYKIICNKLKKLGIEHYDLGSHNILMTSTGKMFVIDWDSAGKYR